VTVSDQHPLECPNEKSESTPVRALSYWSSLVEF